VKISLGQLLSGALVALLPLLAAADQVVPVDEVTSYVKIREAPDASAEIVGRLHRSKPRRHVATVAGWHEVVLDDGSSGFVSSDWSVIVADAGAEPAGEPEDEAEEPSVQEASAPAETETVEAVPDAVAEDTQEPEQLVSHSGARAACLRSW
jgi:hypothetical protein